MKPTVAVLIAVLSLTILPLAAAAETTRDEYVSRAEPICKANKEANARVLKGVRRQVLKGELKKAAARFAKAAQALDTTLNRLEALPQPTEDEATLTKWFGDIGKEVKLLKQESAELRGGNKRAAVRLSAKLVRIADEANAQVIDFGFRYCRANPSEFS